MKKFEKIFFGLLMGSTFPILFFLLSIFTWFSLDRSEEHIPMYLSAALILGFLVDLRFLKRWINNRYNLPIWFVIGIYLFYNVCIYGFFMGFPVFNVLSGLVAGYYSGLRIHFNHIHPDKHSRLINRITVFTGLVMTLICISSGFLALMESVTELDLQGMLRLNFVVTKPMIWGIVILGGIFLISLQMILTKTTMIKTIKAHGNKRRI